MDFVYGIAGVLSLAVIAALLGAEILGPSREHDGNASVDDANSHLLDTRSITIQAVRDLCHQTWNPRTR